MLRLVANLRRRGVLGINQRNSALVLPLNPRRLYPRVDDKVLTKKLCVEAGIPTPGTFGVIAYHHQLAGLPKVLEGLSDFVLKPAHGSQGNGVLVITEVSEGGFRKSSGAILSGAQIRQHVSSMISGVFSLRGDWDSCLIEERIITHPSFDDITRFGVPDVRVIVCGRVPIMAMSRLPTAQSDGRANLHQGAIAAGIDISTGRIVHAVQHDRTIEKHSDTGVLLAGFQVPFWEDVLRLAVRAGRISGLGYLGVDVVVDARRGPVLLELNARPGLAIQLANLRGILPRVERARAAKLPESASDEDLCRFAREHFAHSRC
jgi:alpha-L-glutamate ligase-like protein